jgi:subtilisin family serine protease
MRRGLYLIALFVLMLMFSAAFRPASAPQYIKDEVIVKFAPSLSAASVQSILSSLNAKTIDIIPAIGIRQVKLPSSLSVNDALAALKKSPQVLYAEPNYICRAFAKPNDPLFARLWGLENTGQDGGVSGADINATAAWNSATGTADVAVGIIDSGIDFTHEDLKANIYTNPNEDAWSDPLNPGTGNKVDDDHNGYVDDWKGWNFVSNTNNPNDDNSHGTHVAGTMGAAGNNSVGVAGVCWQVRLLPLKFLDANGNGNTYNAAKAITYAADLKVKVLNNSWGGSENVTYLLEAIEYAAGKGVLFVAASGNDGVNTDEYPNYPSSYEVENVISVAASDQSDQRALWGEDDTPSDNCGFTCDNVMAATPGSNYGPHSVDLAAPGKGIWSTVPGGYARFDGTSMASPHVAGAAALIWSKYPGLTSIQVRDRILKNVDQVAGFNGLVATNGRLNLFKALQ